jgi:glycerol uptake facilitator-like aquaporin
MNLARKAASEFLGTATLTAVAVGSGIMADGLSNGNPAIALLANSIATGAALTFIVLALINISGAHINPVVSLCEKINARLTYREFFTYMCMQISGALAGVGIANLMFKLPVFGASTKVRTGPDQWLAEFAATFGLIGVIYCGTKYSPKLIAVMVACYITSAYWFTSSTAFANPAVTLARSLSDTFAGIRPTDVLVFIFVQILGAVAGVLFFNWLLKEERHGNEEIEYES